MPMLTRVGHTGMWFGERNYLFGNSCHQELFIFNLIKNSLLYEISYKLIFLDLSLWFDIDKIIFLYNWSFINDIFIHELVQWYPVLKDIDVGYHEPVVVAAAHVILFKPRIYRLLNTCFINLYFFKNNTKNKIVLFRLNKLIIKLLKNWKEVYLGIGCIDLNFKFKY